LYAALRLRNSFIILYFGHLFIFFENTMKTQNRRDAIMSIDALPWRKTAEVKGEVPVAQSVVRTKGVTDTD